MQPFDAFRAQPRAYGERMNPRPEQRFVGVDVAHAAHEVLVQQHGFDTGLAPLEPRGELRDSHLQWFRTKLLDSWGQTTAYFDPPKLPLVFVAQHPPVQVHNRMRMSSGRAP